MEVPLVDRKKHWEGVYAERSPLEVSWYQAHPDLSLSLIEACRPSGETAVIDVGAGASVLIDRLLEAGYVRPAVVDISARALRHAQERLGGRAAEVDWFEADVCDFRPPRQFDIWHDRAAFHFLNTPEEQSRYAGVVSAALRPGGHAIIATFAPDGPEKCSGLTVARHDEASIQAALGPKFELVEVRREAHETPGGAVQHFNYFLLKRL
jgi:SAM-dependent methyltransferase